MNCLRNVQVYNSFLLAVFYGFTLFFIQFFFFKTGIVSETPDSVSLLRYDAGIYESISQNGYVYPHPEYNNVGCYILFPFIWHLLHVGIVGISLVNIIFFAIGFAVICNLYPATRIEKILWLSTPSLYFMMVPYTEALFCMLTAFLFYGIAKQNKWLIWATLFFLSLTRATALFLLPCLLIMELLSNERRGIMQSFKFYLFRYASPIVAGTAVFVYIQYVQTHIWFAYFKQQANYLGHKWALPIFPLSNFLGGPGTTWLTGLAIFVSLVALLLLMKYCYLWLKTIML